MVNDKPRRFFKHFRANEDAQKIADALRAALKHEKVANTLTDIAPRTELHDQRDKVDPGARAKPHPETGSRSPLRKSLSSDIRRVLWARSLRAFGDGYVAILLPLHLSRLGYDAFGVGVISTATLLGSALLTLAIGLVAYRIPRRRALLAAGSPDGGDRTGICRDRRLLAAARDRLRRNAQPVRRRRQRLPAARAHGHRPCRRRRGTDGGVRPLQLRRRVLRCPRGALGRHGGLARPGHSHHRPRWRPCSGCTAVIGLLTFFLYRHLSPQVEAGTDSPPAPLGPSRGIVYRLAALFSVDAFGGGLVINALLALWLSERFGISVATIGAIFFVTSLCSAVSYFAAVPLARRFGLINTMVFTHLPSSLFLILTAFAPTIWIAFGLLILRSLLSQMDVPTRSSYVMAVVRPEERPAAASVTAVPRSLASARRAAPVRMAADRVAVRLAARARRHPEGGLRPGAAAAVLGHQAAGGALMRLSFGTSRCCSRGRARFRQARHGQRGRGAGWQARQGCLRHFCWHHGEAPLGVVHKRTHWPIQT